VAERVREAQSTFSSKKIAVFFSDEEGNRFRVSLFSQTKCSDIDRDGRYLKLQPREKY
jgi:hypothetical protein